MIPSIGAQAKYMILHRRHLVARFQLVIARINDCFLHWYSWLSPAAFAHKPSISLQLSGMQEERAYARTELEEWKIARRKNAAKKVNNLSPKHDCSSA
jgi:hypothetical protein